VVRLRGVAGHTQSKSRISRFLTLSELAGALRHRSTLDAPTRPNLKIIGGRARGRMPPQRWPPPFQPSLPCRIHDRSNSGSITFDEFSKVGGACGCPGALLLDLEVVCGRSA
jgi:hypothetical protein